MPLCFIGLAVGPRMPDASAGVLSVRPGFAGTAASLSGVIQTGVWCATLIIAAVESCSALPLGVGGELRGARIARHVLLAP